MPCFSLTLCCRPKPTEVEKVYKLFQDILDSSSTPNQKEARLKAAAEKYAAIYYIYFKGDTVTVALLKHHFREINAVRVPIRLFYCLNLGEQEIKAHLNAIVLNRSSLKKKIRMIEHYRPYYDHIIRQVIFDEED